MVMLVLYKIFPATSSKRYMICKINRELVPAINLEWVTISGGRRKIMSIFLLPRKKRKHKEYSKEQYREMKLDTLTERFMEGTVWVEHSGFIVKEFAKNKNGCPETMSEKFHVRPLVVAKHIVAFEGRCRGRN